MQYIIAVDLEHCQAGLAGFMTDQDRTASVSHTIFTCKGCYVKYLFSFATLRINVVTLARLLKHKRTCK